MHRGLLRYLLSHSARTAPFELQQAWGSRLILEFVLSQAHLTVTKFLNKYVKILSSENALTRQKYGEFLIAQW
jgi:hypothetical protein